MELQWEQTGGATSLRVQGRLDAYWADHLAQALEEAIRRGVARIGLELSGVAYISSAGIRILIRFHHQLEQLGGSLHITNPSQAVREVLGMVGLLEALLREGAPERAREAPSEMDFAAGTARFEITELDPGAALRCEVIGGSEKLARAGFDANDVHRVAFPDDSFGLGLGALGTGYEDCRGRFGESLAAAGAVAFLPSDGTNAPDFMVSRGSLVPELHVLYGLRCRGGFARLAHFEAQSERGTAGFSDVAEACLALGGGEAVGVVMVAECAGLMGAALRRAPVAARGEAAAPFAFPAVREWLSFTSELAFRRGQAVVVGVVAGRELPGLAPLLRPLREGGPAGHFHVAAFSYRPLRRGRLELRETVASRFEDDELLGVLHLLNDDRPVVGGGQSELTRGACWLAPIAEVVGS
jgi:anti-anti-sigma factor